MLATTGGTHLVAVPLLYSRILLAAAQTEAGFSLHLSFPEPQDWQLPRQYGFLCNSGICALWRNQDDRSFAGFLAVQAGTCRGMIRKARGAG